MHKQESKETQGRSLSRKPIDDRRAACMNLKRTCSGLVAGKCKMTNGSCVFQQE